MLFGRIFQEAPAFGFSWVDSRFLSLEGCVVVELMC